MKTRRILYILRHDPWGIGGGCYACRNYLEAFSEVFRGAKIDALVCEEYLEGADRKQFDWVRFMGVKPRGRVSRMLTPLTGITHRHQKMAKQALASKKYDLCIFDDNCIAGTLVDTCRKYGVRSIVINHNCEYEYYRDNLSGIHRTLLLPAIRRAEGRSFTHCDCNIFLTEEDMQTFPRMYGTTKAQNIVGGCFLQKGETFGKYLERDYNKDGLRMVISGTIGNTQNLDGINYFLDELYGYVPCDMKIVITGKNCPAALEEKVKQYGNVSIIANPKDILSVVAECDIFVCPTRLGGGMKLRVMDGLRCGLPVISHDISARGYSRFFGTGYFEHFSTPEEFGKALRSITERINSGEISRREIVDKAAHELDFEGAVERLMAARED